MLDSLLFDVIEEIIADNMKEAIFTSEDRYFESLKKLTDENLLRCLDDKLKFVKINLTLL